MHMDLTPRADTGMLHLAFCWGTRPVFVQNGHGGVKRKGTADMEARKITREDLYEDSVIELSVGADMLNTLTAEHFESLERPEDWGDEYTYETLNRKILAAKTIINNALDVLNLAVNDGAGDYFNAKLKFMASLLPKTKDTK